MFYLSESLRLLNSQYFASKFTSHLKTQLLEFVGQLMASIRWAHSGERVRSRRDTILLQLGETEYIISNDADGGRGQIKDETTETRV
jgi:hypothetical protein